MTTSSEPPADWIQDHVRLIASRSALTETLLEIDAVAYVGFLS